MLLGVQISMTRSLGCIGFEGERRTVEGRSTCARDQGLTSGQAREARFRQSEGYGCKHCTDKNISISIREGGPLSATTHCRSLGTSSFVLHVLARAFSQLSSCNPSSYFQVTSVAGPN